MRPLTFFLGVLLACTIDGPLQSAQAATVAPAPTMKLCLPGNTTVAYSTACPTGTTSTKKICPYGQIVAYSSKCPTSPPTIIPLAYGGNAVGAKACPAEFNPANSVTLGARYKVVGFYGFSTLDTMSGEIVGQPSGGVILNDATHLGDGWFGIWVPADCVAGA